MLRDSVREFRSKLQIKDCPEYTRARIGNAGDGGYVVLEELCAATTEVLTFGVGDDVSFELDFVSRYPKAKCTLCDPTIKALPKEHPNFTFIKQGMPQALYNPTLFAKKSRSLLKMDIEWCEWETLELMDIDTLCSFDQLLIEFHLFSVGHYPGNQYSSYFNMVLNNFAQQVDSNLYKQYAAALQKVVDKFHIFHIHANNSLPKQSVTWCDDIPPLLELSLVRKDLVVVRDNRGPFPTPLDHPNKTDRPDITDYHSFLPGPVYLELEGLK